MQDELWLPCDDSPWLDHGVGSATFSLALLRTTASLRIKHTAWRSIATRCALCTSSSQPSRPSTRVVWQPRMNGRVLLQGATWSDQRAACPRPAFCTVSAPAHLSENRTARSTTKAAMMEEHLSRPALPCVPARSSTATQKHVASISRSDDERRARGW